MEQHRGPGRRRDPSIDDRVLHAAVQIFGELGWSGFTYEEIAKRAAVGKSALYRRWADKDELLVDALSHHLNLVEDADTGSIRGDLLAIAKQLMQGFLGEAGHALKRLSAEASASQAIGERYREWSESQVLAARATVRRAIARGELPESTTVTLIMDTLCGGAINHISAAPPSKLHLVREQIDEFSERLVDFVLAGAGYRDSGDSAPAPREETES